MADAVPVDLSSPRVLCASVESHGPSSGDTISTAAACESVTKPCQLGSNPTTVNSNNVTVATVDSTVVTEICPTPVDRISTLHPIGAVRLCCIV